MVATNQFIYKEDLVIPQGTDFTYVMAIRDRDGDALSLSGISEAHASMKESYYITAGITLAASVSNITAGEMTIGISAADTTNLTPQLFLYDILVITTTGLYTRLVEGKIDLTPQVTRIG